MNEYEGKEAWINKEKLKSYRENKFFIRTSYKECKTIMNLLFKVEFQSDCSCKQGSNKTKIVRKSRSSQFDFYPHRRYPFLILSKRLKLQK